MIDKVVYDFCLRGFDHLDRMSIALKAESPESFFSPQNEFSQYNIYLEQKNSITKKTSMLLFFFHDSIGLLHCSHSYNLKVGPKRELKYRSNMRDS